ncbi:aldolase [Cryphonectria parasitica EP155]|uniref:Aldolase n=1 Tax=Cryphonectria parasitica (strain ATCC 38755 / EP155) TaxID=660469 RepID=A0A9P4Y2D4_CRYP1|nr:aldolase [Cryphonectria parasitica EP155]KAF3765373.1 aldolase [Cryphonectria parasitica EP155]
MAEDKASSWLEKLEEQRNVTVNVDVDWMDAEYIKTMPQRLGLVPHDQTSNQLWVDVELHNEVNAEFLKQTALELKDKGWLHIYTRASVLLCKKNIDNIRGRALLQTLPSQAYDEQATIAHARLYDQEFKRVGITRSRYCIKIPATGPALNAAKVLSQDLDEEGLPIATLGTAIFGLPQAIAASQANMLYISPYFNEIRAHNDLSIWPNVEDPATQHPMSARVVQMIQTYKTLYKDTGKPQPKMKLASFISSKEVLAAAEFGCHSATISPKLLDELATLTYDGATPHAVGIVPKPHPSVEYYQSAGPTPVRLQKLATIDPLAAAEWDGQLASTKVDYLADGGAALHKAIEDDAITKTRLAAALETFTEAENKSKQKIEAVLASL